MYFASMLRELNKQIDCFAPMTHAGRCACQNRFHVFVTGSVLSQTYVLNVALFAFLIYNAAFKPSQLLKLVHISYRH